VPSRASHRRIQTDVDADRFWFTEARHTIETFHPTLHSHFLHWIFQSHRLLFGAALGVRIENDTPVESARVILDTVTRPSAASR
jgi:hypothetical protein